MPARLKSFRPEQMRALLAEILFLASPGYHDDHERTFAMLRLAEDIAKEHSAALRG